MNKFIKIDLSTFFDDERKMVLIMLDKKWVNVSQLSHRIEELFGVEGVRFLSNDGYFIPLEEPIAIIQYCADLKAFIPKRKKKKSNKHKVVNVAAEDEKDSVETAGSGESEVNDNAQKKRKYRSLECGFVASSTPNNSKRIKNYTGINATLTNHRKEINKSSEISSTSEQQMPPPISPPCMVTIPKSKKKKCNLSAAATAVNEEITIVEEEAQELPVKSKTKQKSSKTAEEKSIGTSATPPTERIANIPSSTFINEIKKSRQNPFKNQSSTMNHLRFDETGEISTTTLNKTTQNKENEQSAAAIKVIFYSALHETDAKRPRIFNIRHNNNTSPRTSDKTKIEIQENIILRSIILPDNNSLNASQVFETAQSDENEASASDTEKSLVTDTNSKEKEKEGSSVDEGNSSLNDTNISTVSTAIDTCASKSKEVAKLDENNQSANITTVTDDGQLEISKIQTTNDESVSICKDENEADESSIVSVDCVDLSVDLEEIVERKKGTKRIKSDSDIEDISISDTSDVEEISEVIDLNESEDHNDSYSSLKNKSSLVTIKVINIIGLCKDTKDLPVTSDIMIFKVPFINRQGNPDCTKFLAGKVERIQQRSKLIKLQILDGHSEMCYVPAKYFDHFLDNSSCEQSYIQIKHNEMIQPRILPKNKRSMFSLL